MAVDLNNLNTLIAEFRAQQVKDSITPESLGYLLSQIVQYCVDTDGRIYSINVSQNANGSGLTISTSTGLSASIPLSTAEAAGLMSAADKVKLDGLWKPVVEVAGRASGDQLGDAAVNDGRRILVEFGAGQSPAIFVARNGLWQADDDYCDATGHVREDLVVMVPGVQSNGIKQPKQLYSFRRNSQGALEPFEILTSDSLVEYGIVSAVTSDKYIRAEHNASEGLIALSLRDAALPGRAVVTVESLYETLWSGEFPTQYVAFTPGETSGRWKALGYPQAGDIVEIHFEDNSDYTIEAVIALVETAYDGSDVLGYYCKLDLSDDAGWQMPYYMTVYHAMPGSGTLNTDEQFNLGFMANYAAGLTPAGYFFTGTGASALASNKHAWEHLRDAAAADAAWVQIQDDGITYRGLLQQRTQSNALVSVNDGMHFRTYSITKAGDTVTVTRVDNAEFNTEVASHVAPAYAAIQQLSKDVDAAKLQLFIDMWNAAWVSQTLGKFDPDNAPDPEHPFMGNGLWMTYTEAVKVFLAGPIINNAEVFYSTSDIRTNIPRRNAGSAVRYASTFYNNSHVEVVSCQNAKIDNSAFYRCSSLRQILGANAPVYSINEAANPTGVFTQCANLEFVQGAIRGTLPIDVRDCPKLTYENFRYWLDNAYNTVVVPITVHPDVYARLTDDAEELAPYVRPNLLLGSDVEVTTDSYLIKKFTLDGTPKSGQRMTITIWGELGEGKQGFLITNKNGTNGLITAYKVADGAYSAKLNWVPAQNTTAQEISVYAMPNAVTTVSTINKIKLTFGEVEDDEWTPPIDAITDPELKERAQWVALVAEAESKNIQFATTE